MKTIRFKTNLKCSNCVAKVQKQLDEEVRIIKWSVDLQSPDRVLSIETENDGVEAVVMDILKVAGYRAMKLS